MVKPYCIGSKEWSGLSKLIEECGEVMQVAGKIIGNEGGSIHFDGSHLPSRLTLELGDLLAAINFVIDQNDLDLTKIQERRDDKLNIFQQWQEQQDNE